MKAFCKAGLSCSPQTSFRNALGKRSQYLVETSCGLNWWQTKIFKSWRYLSFVAVALLRIPLFCWTSLRHEYLYLLRCHTMFAVTFKALCWFISQVVVKLFCNPSSQWMTMNTVCKSSSVTLTSSSRSDSDFSPPHKMAGWLQHEWHQWCGRVHFLKQGFANWPQVRCFVGCLPHWHTLGLWGVSRGTLPQQVGRG